MIFAKIKKLSGDLFDKSYFGTIRNSFVRKKLMMGLYCFDHLPYRAITSVKFLSNFGNYLAYFKSASNKDI